ncbi:hypothetical protein QVA66_07705 [Staphylococcus chromogenes]|nr:hypothetical protein [Staphylococcus chromogenes]
MRLHQAISWPMALLVGWTVFLTGAQLWPLAAPGMLLHRDMAVLPHPALSRAALGFGDLPARNAPQDGVLALLGQIVDATWVVRVLLLAAALLGAYGAWCAAQVAKASTLGTWAAVTLTLCNPFLVERFLQGHWSLNIAAVLLPGLVAWGRQSRPGLQLGALWLCSLTPTGAVAGTLIALLFPACRRSKLAVFALLAACPWLIPSLLAPATSSLAGATAFAARAESPFGLLASVVGLGGVWNSAAVPNSRTGLSVLAGVALFIILLTTCRTVPRRLLALAGGALCAVCISAWIPSISTWLITHVPGCALFRDSHKLVIFVIPAYVFLAARLRGKWAAVALCLMLLQVWDAPGELQALRPAPVPDITHTLAQQARNRDVFIPDAPTIVNHRGNAAVNPISKAVPLVEDGSLIVDGALIDTPSPRHAHATACWNAHDLTCLRQLEIGLVLDHGHVIDLGGSPHRGWPFWLGLGLTVQWLALGPACYALQQRRKFSAG